jgi:hypothetical protein
MAISIVKSSGEGKFEQIEEGVWESVIVSIEERKEFNNFKQAELDVLRISYEITEGAEKGKTAVQSYNPNISPKSNLQVLCRAVLGRDFTPEELAAINTSDDVADYIVGRPVQILVKKKISKKGNPYYFLTDYVKSKYFREGEGKPVEPVAQPSAATEEVSEEEINKIAEDIDRGATQKATPRPTSRYVGT